MMKTIALAMLFVLAGCDTNNYAIEVKDKPLPEGMEGCRHFMIGQNNGGNQSIWRCPNSTTTSSQGKAAPITVTE